MTRRPFTALAAVLLAGSMAVSAQAQPTSAPPAAKSTPAANGNSRDPNEVVCKERGSPGHLGGRRICGTRAQWDQVARDGADELTKVQNNSRFNSNPIEGGGSMAGPMGGH